MAKEDQKMYELVCKDRFDKIDNKLDDISKKLFKGNGKPIDVRIAEQNKDILTLKSRWKWMAGVLAGILIWVGKQIAELFIN